MRRLLAAATLVVLTSTVAQSQAADTTSASATPASLGGWLGLARHSPTNLFGGTQGRETIIGAVRLQRPFAGSQNVSWDYTLDLFPLVWISAHDRKLDPNLPTCPSKGQCVTYVDIENRHAVYGFGAAPAGLQMRARPGETVQPFADVGAGALVFREPMPSAHSNRFNFIASAGAGVHIARPGKLGVTLGYRLVHISNGGTGTFNPGLDNHLFYAGLMRAPNARITDSAKHIADVEDANSIVGSARVDLNGQAIIGEGSSSYWMLGGSVSRFFSKHWQLGLSPEYRVVVWPGPNVQQSVTAGTANLVLGNDQLRGYVGGWLGAVNGTQQTGITLMGAQVGALHFLSSTAAIRSELRWRRTQSPGATVDALINLDAYAFGRANERPVLPTFGNVDVTAQFYGSLQEDRVRSVDAMVAPFLASWMQVGAQIHHVSAVLGRRREDVTNLDGFARLYAPFSPRFMPFAQAFAMTLSHLASSPLSGYGAFVGARHYLNVGTALDAGVQWTRFPTWRISGATIQQPDHTTLQARIVTSF